MLVPNSKLLENTVVNWTLSDKQFRVSITVGVAYGSDIELVRRTLERYGSAQVKEGPERVARAIEEALSSPVPRPRKLVVSDQRDAELAISRELQKVAQLNQAHPFSYDRNTLVKMLDEALANPGGGGATMSKVTGTVSYRERIALPPAATIRVQLVDVSRADAPADVLGEQLIEAAGRLLYISAQRCTPAAA